MGVWPQHTQGARNGGDVAAADDDAHSRVGHADVVAQLGDRRDDL